MLIVSGWRVSGLRIGGLKCATRTRLILLFVSKISILTCTHIGSSQTKGDPFNPFFKQVIHVDDLYAGCWVVSGLPIMCLMVSMSVTSK
ncbi:hypothetical protein Hanom_Chr07g00656501 [Helianthus anomalus]